MEMNVLHLVSGNLTGGAARGAYWLHQGLLNLGIKSKVVSNSKVKPENETVKYLYTGVANKLKVNLNRFLDGLPLLFYRNKLKTNFSCGLLGYNFVNTDIYKQADVIHLHWVNYGLLSIKHIKRIKKPIVWTLRDMWPFTGGCHYSIDCERYKIGCGKCYQLGSKKLRDLSLFLNYYKSVNFPKHMTIVGISDWISKAAKDSNIFKEFDIHTISNNVNCQEFIPVEKTLARKKLNINTTKKVILVGAHDINCYYKGFDKFLEAYNLLNKEKYLTVFFGNLKTDYLPSDFGEYLNAGFLYDSDSLRLVYSCADVFVAPSIMDAFGKTIVESMACGTPVVCFDATGPRDIVEHLVNGYKASPFNTHDLKQGIEWVIQNSSSFNLAKRARQRASQVYDNNVIAQHYANLYSSIIK